MVRSMAGEYLQLWIPLLPINAYDGKWSRDLQRATREWRRESTIWFLDAGIEDTRRWKLSSDGATRSFEMAVPSARPNVVYVVHVNPDGFFFPPWVDSIPKTWNGRIPKGLYEDFLNSEVLFYSGIEELTWRHPIFKNDDVMYVSETIGFEPGPLVPIVATDDESRTVLSCWPPPGSKLPTPPISVEEESKEYYGISRPTTVQAPEGQDLLASNSPGQAVRGLNVTPLIDEGPFNELFSLGLSMDTLYQIAQMKDLIGRLAANREVVIKEVEALLCNHLSDATTPFWLGWWLPKVLHNRDGALMDLEGRFGIQADSVQQAEQQPEFQRIMSKPLNVKRIIGWPGYFWWEIYKDISTLSRVQVCPYCGKILRGGNKGRGCRPEENPECNRQRAAERTRRKRARNNT
jgi:hypothetical protein